MIENTRTFRTFSPSEDGFEGSTFVRPRRRVALRHPRLKFPGDAVLFTQGRKTSCTSKFEPCLCTLPTLVPLMDDADGDLRPNGSFIFLAEIVFGFLSDFGEGCESLEINASLPEQKPRAPKVPSWSRISSNFPFPIFGGR